MAQVNPRELNERDLHEYVAEVEGHDSQVTGVVGYFYRMYRAEVLARVEGVPGRRILEVGCGEGMMFDGTATTPVQMDVSMTRVARAAGKCRFLLCGDGYQLPFAQRIVRRRAAHRRPRAHARAVASARRGAARAGAGGPSHHGRAQRRDDERGPARASQVSDPLPGSPDVHDAASHAAVAVGRLHASPKRSTCRSGRCRSPSTSITSSSPRKLRREAGVVRAFRPAVDKQA